MGIDLTARLVETATKVSVTKNEYGDLVYGTTTTAACLYRDISSLKSGSAISGGNRQEVVIDGLLWFAGTEDVNKDDIYYHPDEGYLRIEKVIKAKRLVADNTLQFIKCEVRKQRQLS